MEFMEYGDEVPRVPIVNHVDELAVASGGCIKITSVALEPQASWPSLSSIVLVRSSTFHGKQNFELDLICVPLVVPSDFRI